MHEIQRSAEHSRIVDANEDQYDVKMREAEELKKLAVNINLDKP